MERQPYPSDLTDEQWEALQRAVPKPKKPGRPPKYPRREIWNAIFYQDRTGCQWRALPHDLPPWNLVWEHFGRWRDRGLIQRVHEALRTEVRVQAGRQERRCSVRVVRYCRWISMPATRWCGSVGVLVVAVSGLVMRRGLSGRTQQVCGG